MSRAMPPLAVAALLVGGCTGLVNDRPFEPAVPQAAWTSRSPLPASGGSLYRAGSDIRLFEDRTARRVGDILTIRLVERTDASKSASTSIAKDSDIRIQNPILFGKMPSVEGYTLETRAQGERLFEGEGASDQSNRLSGQITAVVVGVYPNGNLSIRGDKKLTLNQGDEYVRISGVVRPDDIRADNSVLSSQVADAQIAYAGTGAPADANAVGWLGRFFLHPLWPF